MIEYVFLDLDDTILDFGQQEQQLFLQRIKRKDEL